MHVLAAASREVGAVIPARLDEMVRRIAANPEAAAWEIDRLSRLVCEWRDKFNRQLELRVEAQMRAARLARDSRR